MSNLIKGYLPIRISLPFSGKDDGDDAGACESTFIFVKQHISSSSVDKSSRTLFVTNTPVYPLIQTSILLQSIFERYADVEKIIVAPKPSKSLEQSTGEENDAPVNPAAVEDMTLKIFEKEIRAAGFGADKSNILLILDEETWCDQGRYAHVIFKTCKDMKKVMKAFQGKGQKIKKKTTSCEQTCPIVKLSQLEIQELQDISHQRFRNYREHMYATQHDPHGDETRNSGEDDDGNKKTGILALAQRHRDKIIARDTLKKLCDQIMEKYEEAEAEALRKQKEAMKQPDEDGFVTVSYSTNVGDAIQFEQNRKLGTAGSGRRKRERTRSTKKNILKGSDELPDFYRFQLKESKKRSLEDLKTRFQEDLKRVKLMKEEKMFRPF